MTESVAVDSQPVVKAAATVSASTLALHLDCSRTYLTKLQTDGVIQRQGDGRWPTLLIRRETGGVVRLIWPSR